MEKNKYQAHAEVLVKLSTQLDLVGKGLDKVLGLVTQTVAHTLEVEQVSIWQFNAFSKLTRCISLHNQFEIQKPELPIDLSMHNAYLAALQAEQAIASSDVSTDIRVATFPTRFWVDPQIKSYLHVPIRMTNQLAGILRMDTRSEHAWDPEDIQFCVQAAGLVAQILLTNELRIKDERYTMIRSLSTDLTYRFEVPTLLSDLVRKSVEMVSGSYGALFLTDPERRLIVSTAGYNMPARLANQTFNYGEHVAGKVAETGQELLIKDYRSWPGRTDEMKKDEEPVTILSVPLRTRGEVTGVLQVTRRDGDQPFLEHDRETLVSFANLACLAIEQNRLIEANLRLGKFQESMKKILETTTLASSVMDFLETSIDYVTHALTSAVAVICIDDVCTTRGLAMDAHKHIEQVLLKHGKRFNPIMVMHDTGLNDGGFPEMAQALTNLGTRAAILAPILLNHERVGYVCIGSKTPRSWAADEIKMVDIAANQIGLAVEGMRFFRENQMQIDVVKRMTSATSSLNRLVSMDDLIPMIGEGAVRLFNSDSLALILREQNEIVRASWIFGLPKPQFSRIIDVDGKEWLQMFAAEVEPTLISNIARSSLPAQIKSFLIAADIKTVKLAPITYSGNVVGVIAGFHETPQDWSTRDRHMIVAFTNTVSLALQNTWSYEQLSDGYIELAVSLADTLDARESRVKAGSLRVADWAQRTAQKIGLPREEQEAIRLAALLHDIGKVDVPEDVLRKTSPLTNEEKKQLQTYPITSEKMVGPLNSHHEIGVILRGIRERFDGSGYPDRRMGEDIPLAARILAVADAYASMLDNRSYRTARSHEAALEEIKKNSGKQFDPRVVDAFLQTVNSHSELIH